MQKGNLFTFGFALLICLFCSLALAIAATNLKGQQDLSARLYQVKNVLSVAGKDSAEIARIEKENPDALIKEFQTNFQSVIIDKNNQPVNLSKLQRELVEKLGYQASDLESRTAFEINDIFKSKLSLLAKASKQTEAQYDKQYKLLFLYKPTSDIEAYIVPVAGKGLWGDIKGYVALEPDLITIKDIRFYEQVETPGLGGECDKPWFTNLFKGKKILNAQGEFKSVSVTKGKVINSIPDETMQIHFVDGISGGTITSQGITRLMHKSLIAYNDYFSTLRSAQSTQQIESGPITTQSEETP